LTDGAEVSRGISALVPKCLETLRHHSVLVLICLGAEVSGKRCK